MENLTGHHMRSHCKYGQHWCCHEVMPKSYLVISSVAFSPSFMVVTPSSQPAVCCQLPGPRELCRVWRGSLTLDDLANANGCNEVTAANGGVEPEERRSQRVSGMWIVAW